MKLGFKTLIAPVAAACVLLLSSAPAGAVTDNFLTATGGSLNTAVGNFTLGGGGTTPPCGASTGGITIRINDLSGGSHTTAVVPNATPATQDIRTSFTFSGNTYLAHIAKAASGTHTGTINASTLAISQNTRLTALIYATTLPGCAQGSLVCTATVNLSGAAILTGSLSAAPSAVGAMATGDTATVSGTGPVATSACPAPLDVLGGSTVTASNLQLTK